MIFMKYQQLYLCYNVNSNNQYILIINQLGTNFYVYELKYLVQIQQQINPDYDHYVKDEQLQNGTGEGWMTKDNKKIGKWILRYEDRIEEGEYLNGKKINQWIITNKITNVIETGCYDNLNFKTGEWISYVEGDSASYLKIIYNRNKEQKRIKVDSILISTIKLKQ